MEELYREWMRDWKPAGNSKFKMAAKIRGVLIDLSGTIHVENSVIPGSIQALKRYGRTVTHLGCSEGIWRHCPIRYQHYKRIKGHLTEAFDWHRI